MSLDREKLLKLIESCSFLGEEITNKWQTAVRSLPEKYCNLIYKTFQRIYTVMNMLYMEIELGRDTNHEYKRTIQDKFENIIKLIATEKLKSINP